MKNPSKGQNMKSNEIIAARGLLKWSQSDLEKASGVSARSIGQIENDKQTPNQSTLATIELAFERAGVVLKDGGLFLVDRSIKVFEGNDCHLKLFSDIEFATQCNEELLIDGADESLTPSELVEKVKQLRIKGLKMRHLIRYQKIILLIRQFLSMRIPLL
jgi:transcriptional regulator with XRE-family HTH domain